MSAIISGGLWKAPQPKADKINISELEWAEKRIIFFILVLVPFIWLSDILFVFILLLPTETTLQLKS